jgi:trypsin
MKRIACVALLSLAALEASADGPSQKEIAHRLREHIPEQNRARVEELVTSGQVLFLRLQKDQERAKIIGPDSKAARPGEFPYMAALLVQDADGQRYQFCGGTLIGRRKILTAAHCHLFFDSAVRVMIGETKVSEGGPRAVEILEFVEHPDFSETRTGSDVAVITLKNDVDGIQPVSLSAAEPADQDGVALARVMGWGQTVYLGPTNDVLLHTRVPFVSNATCKELFPFLLPTMICGGEKEATQGNVVNDTCKGDSGGPAFWIRPQNAVTQVGIVSFGRNCGVPGFYTVYTRTAAFREWILKQ